MSMHGKFFPSLIGILLFFWSMPFLMADIVVRFPTENTALLDNRPQDFYMKGRNPSPGRREPTALPGPSSEPRQAP